MTSVLPSIKKMRQTEAEMREAVGAATLAWSELEHRFAYGLDYLLRQPYGFNVQMVGSSDLGVAIYYTATNAETRIAIVDTIFRRSVPYFMHGRAIVRCWAKLLERTNRAKGTRNKIAHGHMKWVGLAPSNKVSLRITPPAYWDEPSIEEPPPPSLERPRRPPRPQYPGMSISDVRSAAKTFADLQTSVEKMFGVIKEVRKVPFDWRASRRKLLELGYRLNLKREELIGQNPPIPGDPPEPSQA